MTAPVPAREDLDKLLFRYNEYPDEREEVIAEIARRFQQSLAILVIDSCGFSLRVHSLGIVHTLALLERLQRLIVSVIEKHGGRFLRHEADNLFAVFQDPGRALACAEVICEEVAIANSPLPAGEEIYVSIGVGYGDVLVVGADDVYGEEMNLACKLGEDLADRGEILLTEAAFAAIKESRQDLQPATYSISGLDLQAYRLER